MTSFHISLGHRPHKVAAYDLTVQFYRLLQSTLEVAIAGALKVHPHLTLHSGLALGADNVWSQAILSQRALYPDRITFVAGVPTMGQASVWRGSGDREFWQHEIDVADQVNVYSDRYKVPLALTYDWGISAQATSRRHVRSSRHEIAPVAIGKRPALSAGAIRVPICGVYESATFVDRDGRAGAALGCRRTDFVYP